VCRPIGRRQQLRSANSRTCVVRQQLWRRKFCCCRS